MADIKALFLRPRINTKGLQGGPSPARNQADCGVHLKVFRVVFGKEGGSTMKARIYVLLQVGSEGKYRLEFLDNDMAINMFGCS